MKKYFYALCLMVFFTTPFSSRASHAQGADLWYKFVSYDTVTHNTQYLVTATFYRDCAGIAAPSTIALSVTDTLCTGGTYAMTATMQMVTGLPCPFGGVSGGTGCEVSHLCPTALSLSTCAGGSQYPGMQKYVYQVYITIPGNISAYNCDKWYISIAENARNSSDNVTGGGSADLYVEAVINNAIDPHTGRPYANSSPTFLNDPVPFFCMDNAAPLTYNNGTLETDGDSVVYALQAPLQSHNNPLIFNSGFSMTQPIVSSFPCIFDPATGILTFDPTQVNTDVLAYRITEFRHGVMVGAVMRDVQVKILNCRETPPVFGTPVVQGGILQNADLVTGCQGDRLSVDIPVTSTGIIASLESNISTYASYFPGMTFTPSGSGSSMNAHIEWSSVDTGCHYVYIKATSDDCPVEAASYLGLRLCPDHRVVISPRDGIYCGRPVHLTVSGGSSPVWSPAVAISGTTGTAADVYPAVSTWYSVHTGCGADSVLVRTAPAFSASISHDTTICNGNALQLHDIVSGPGLYSYTWSPAADLYTASGLPGAHSSFPVLRTAQSGTYTCVVTDTSGCQITDSVHVIVRGPGLLSVTGDTLVAPSTVAHLQASVMNYLPGCTTIADSSVSQVAEVRIGLDTAIQVITGFGYPSPFGNYYKSARHQILFKAAELQAALGSSRVLSSISLQIGTLYSTSAVTNFTVKIACVHADSLTGYVGGSDLKTVVSPITFTPQYDWNRLVFDHPYVWDGVSDLVVDMCFLNTTAGNINSRFRYSATPYRSIYCTYGNDPAGQCGYTGFQQNAQVSYSRYFQRLNVKFGTAIYHGNSTSVQWQPAAGINAVDSIYTAHTTAHPQSDQWYTAFIADSVCPQADSTLVRVTTHGIHTPQNVSICAGDSILLLASNAATYAWSDSSGLLSTAASFYYYPSQSSDVILVMVDNGGQVHTDTSHITVLSETVWPGDVNRDHAVNHNDLLYLGIAYGHYGPPRPAASIVWTPQCAQRWGYHFIFGGDYAYADCDGDGQIAPADTLAISQNWGLTHPKTEEAARAGTSFLTITTDAAVYHLHDTIRATISLGDTNVSVQQLYGVALRVDYGGTGTARVVRMDQSLSWTGQQLSMARVAGPGGAAYLAQTRIDHRDTAGHGAIAQVWYVVDAATAQLQSVSLFASPMLALTSTGDTVLINGDSHSFTLDARPLGIEQQDRTVSITIAPNPTTGHVRILMAEVGRTAMTICDAIGREVYQGTLSEESTDLDLSALPVGVYTIHFISSGGQGSRRLIIAR